MFVIFVSLFSQVCVVVVIVCMLLVMVGCRYRCLFQCFVLSMFSVCDCNVLVCGKFVNIVVSVFGLVMFCSRLEKYQFLCLLWLVQNLSYLVNSFLLIWLFMGGIFWGIWVCDDCLVVGMQVSMGLVWRCCQFVCVQEIIIIGILFMKVLYDYQLLLFVIDCFVFVVGQFVGVQYVIIVVVYVIEGIQYLLYVFGFVDFVVVIVVYLLQIVGGVGDLGQCCIWQQCCQQKFVFCFYVFIRLQFFNCVVQVCNVVILFFLVLWYYVCS